MTLDAAITIWDDAEASAEVKIDALRRHVYHALGMHADPDSYMTSGPLLERFAAGIIDRYISLCKTLLFVALDPLHVVDILVSLIKNIFRHPVKLMKNMWEFWTYIYTHGAYGAGIVVADALLAGVLAGGALAATGASVRTAATSGMTAVADTVEAYAVSAPQQAITLARQGAVVAAGAGDVYTVLLRQPQLLLQEAKKVLLGKVTSFGELNKLKFYCNGLLRRHQRRA